MDDKKQQQQSEESRMESSVLKLQEGFHQFIQECLDCRREIESHWQFWVVSLSSVDERATQ